MHQISVAVFLGACTFLTLGCSPEPPKSEQPAKDRIKVEKKTGGAMEFTIGKTEFGFDAKKSKFEITEQDEDRFFLTIELRGDDDIARKLSADEKSGWSWISYGPHF